MKTSIFLIIFLSVITNNIFSAELITYEENGPRDKMINIVIVAEGYQASEKSSFITHIGDFVGEIFSDPVLAAYRKYHNIYGVFVASNESGADDPNGGVTRDTYFDATYNASGIDRLLVVGNYSLLNSEVNSVLPEHDIIMVSVNYDKYGGSGGSIAVSSYSSPEIAAHEIGHSFVGLKDEYSSSTPITAYEGINATQQTTYSQISWNQWIEQSTPLPTDVNVQGYDTLVGAFEGANYNSTGWYRPQYSCRMRSNGVNLCHVCSEAWLLSIYDIVSSIDSTIPNSSSVVNVSSGDSLKVLTKELVGTAFKYEWLVDNVLVNGEDSATYFPENLSDGAHTIKVFVSDTTSYVRKDEQFSLNDTVEWSVIWSNSTTLSKKSTLFNQNKNIKIFSNNNNLSFELPNINTKYKLEIINFNGKTIKQKYSYNGKILIKHGELPSGVFIYRITGLNKKISGRFIIK